MFTDPPGDLLTKTLFCRVSSSNNLNLPVFKESRMASIPVVREFRVVKKGLLAKVTRISFKCPHCEASLIASQEEVGVPDTCPHCGKGFMIDKRAKAAFEVSEGQTATKQAESDAEIRKLQAQQESDRKLEEQKQQQLAEAEAQQKLNEARERQHQAALMAQKKAETLKEEMEDGKEEFRNQGIRTYPSLAFLAEACDFVANINVLLSAAALLGCFSTSWPTEWKVAVTIGVVVQCAVLTLALKVLSGFVLLAVNVAQDTERLLLAREADAGKPWAKF
jgi:hypothetical protein